MTLLLIFSVLAAFAVAVEALNLIAPDFLATLHRDAVLKDSIAKTQKEVAESEKRLDSLRTKLRNIQLEMSRTADGLEQINEQFAERRRVTPILIYPISATRKVSYRFRAPISKTLPSEPEEGQTLMWAGKAFVEVEANTSDEAHRIALRQFPSQQGYAIGQFEQSGIVTEAAA
jgi:DNA gyrase/topoisomerase IV subunit A